MLSIIIPTLNEEKYLNFLLDSIKKQDYTDYEIIVADAGSKDRTVDIAKEYGCKIVKGGLLPVGRNKGAEVAQGDIFLFLDADVILSDNFLKNAVELFKKNKLGIAGFPVVPINAKTVDKLVYNIFNGYIQLVQKILPHAATAIMSTRKAHNAAGGFDEEIKFLEDFSYVKKVAKNAEYGFINQPVFNSLRRYDKDGRIVYMKYILAELHIIFIGPIKSDIFRYRFGHYKDEVPNNNCQITNKI